MKISLKLEYQDKTYTSDCIQMSEEEYEKMTELIEKIVGGRVGYFSFKQDNREFYFGEKILQESIITVTKVA